MKIYINKSYSGKNLLRKVTLSLCIPCICFMIACKKTSTESKETKGPTSENATKSAKVVLKSSLAGRWYPDDTQALNEQITGFFEKAQVKATDDIIALILPHAGYAYSGQIAALGLKTLGKQYERVVIIGPSHGVHMEEMLSIPRVTHYETPLGQIPLDTEFIDKLLTHSVFQNVPHAHEYEHSVQIELPLLQYCQKDFKLVPIVAGTCSQETIDEIGVILKGLIDNKTLVVASSDFVHYGQNYNYVPFKEDIPEKIKELDMGAYEYIENLDSNGFLEYKRKTGATICGYIPISILLSILEKPTEVKLIKYTTSGQLTGDFTNSVSYLSAAFSGKWNPGPLVKPLHNNPGLTDQDKKQLLVLARKSILFALKSRRIPQESDLSATISEAMRQPRAAFVTLKKKGQLRGCIGDIFPRQPLYKSVIANAINACVNDRRFLPVSIAECNDITIEISALTPPSPVACSADIRTGVDGVVLRKDGKSAVFLPQVAPEQGWDLETTLTHLSMKAGLPADAWKEGAAFLTFQADVFGENEK